MTLKEMITSADNAYYATEYDKSIKIYKRILKLDPKNKHARNQLQKAEYNRSLKSKLEELPTEALQLYRRSRSFIAMGDRVEATKLLKKAIESAAKAGVDFLDAKDLLRNMHSALRAEGFKRKANKDINRRQWLKAEAGLSVAIDLDPTDHSIAILKADLKSLLKAQKLVQELDSVAEDSKDFLQIDEELHEILERTKETHALSELWQELFETRKQIKKKNAFDDSYQYDIFISYSHKDKRWVQKELLPTLERHGLRVCVDYRDFIAGKPSFINMQEASVTSRHTLLVVSPGWIQSEWTFYEGILSRTADPAGLKRRTIPILLKKCTLPDLISMLTWVDFTNKRTQTESWQFLFKSLRKKN